MKFTDICHELRYLETLPDTISFEKLLNSDILNLDDEDVHVSMKLLLT